MENDSVRSSGATTLVDMWIDGKLRAIEQLTLALGGSLAWKADTPRTSQTPR